MNSGRFVGPLPSGVPNVPISELLLVQGLCTAGLLDIPPGVDPVLARVTATQTGLTKIPWWITLWTDTPIEAATPTTTLHIRGELCTWPEHLPRAIPVPTAPLSHLHGYKVEFFGAFFPSGKELDTGRVWDITLPGEYDPSQRLRAESPGRQVPETCFRTWRQRAYLDNTALYAELRWPLELEGETQGREPYVRFGGLEHKHSVSELRKLDAAIGLLRRIPRAGWAELGRPENYRDANEPQFFKDLGMAAHKAVKNGDPVSFSSLARHGLASRPTVTAAVKHFGYDLAAVEREAVRCTQGGAGFCTFVLQRMDKFKEKRQ